MLIRCSERLMNDKLSVLLVATRAALLALIDAIEEYLDMPRTKELRRAARKR